MLRPKRAAERGAILLHVAVALVVLIAILSWVADYGLMLVSRGQAQNSADSGAMAAAIYMAWDGPGDQPGAQDIAVAAAQRNLVWGDLPDVTPADVTFPPCPPGAPGPPDTCVRVDVFRDRRAGGSPLPVTFASLVGIADQAVRATATAQILYPEASECVKPFAIPDKWIENYPVPLDDADGDGDPWDPTDTFDTHDAQGNPLATPDQYIAPTWGPDGNVTDPGSGYQLPTDYGLILTLKSENQSQIVPSWYQPVIINPDDGPGGDAYRDNIAECDPTVINPPTTLTNEPGNMVGPTFQGIEDLINLDPDAWWDPTWPNGVDGDGNPLPPGKIRGGCMEAVDPDPTCSVSPRIAAVPVFNVDSYLQGRANGREEVDIVRVLGMFFLPMNKKNGEVTGVLVTYPSTATGDSFNNTGSFLRTIVLVR